jgi:hypothetical protein
MSPCLKKISAPSFPGVSPRRDPKGPEHRIALNETGVVLDSAQGVVGEKDAREAA